MAGTGVATVQPGDRIDTLAYRLYGNPEKYTLLVQANPDLDIWAPQPGQVILVPEDQSAA